MRRFAVLLTVAVVVLLARTGWASEPESSEARGVVVVMVASDAAELDVSRVRAAIGQELESDAVGPDDAGASSARGRIDVSIDRASRQLVVSYRGDSDEALVRRVDLPGDAEATLRAAVLLAGNLARDEATEIVAELRKPKAPAAGSLPAAPPAPALSASSSDEQELARSEYLRHLLAYYAARDRRVRLVTAWTALGVAVAVDGAVIYAKARNRNDIADVLSPIGLELTIPAAIAILTPAAFERMSAYYEAHVATTPFPEWLREDVERRWKREADKAHQWHIIWGVACTALGAVSVGLGVLLWETEPPATQDRVGDSISIVGGVAVMSVGIFSMATESATESRLHEYERGLGHPIVPAEVGLRVTPVRGGVVAGLGGRF